MTIQDFFRVFLGIQIKLEWFWVLRINLGICTLNGKDLSMTVDNKQRAGCKEFPTAVHGSFERLFLTFHVFLNQEFTLSLPQIDK